MWLTSITLPVSRRRIRRTRSGWGLEFSSSLTRVAAAEAGLGTSPVLDAEVGGSEEPVTMYLRSGSISTQSTGPGKCRYGFN